MDRPPQRNIAQRLRTSPTQIYLDDTNAMMPHTEQGMYGNLERFDDMQRFAVELGNEPKQAPTPPQRSKLRVRDMIQMYNMATEKQLEQMQPMSVLPKVAKTTKHPIKEADVEQKFDGSGDCKPAVENESYEAAQSNYGVFTARDVVTASRRVVAMAGNTGSGVELVKQSTDKRLEEAKSKYNKDAVAVGNTCYAAVAAQKQQHHTRKRCNRTSKFAKSNRVNCTNQTETHIKDMSYDSKTTIRKTDFGVRIVIDIELDKVEGVKWPNQ